MFFQENLGTFLTIAEELRLKGLTGGPGPEALEKLPTVKDIFEPPRKFIHDVKRVIASQTPHPKPLKKDPNFLYQYSDGTLAVQNDGTISVDLEKLNDQIASMIEPTNKVGRLGGKMVACKVCGKEGYKSDVANHIELNHITGVSHSCDVCGKTVRSREALRIHKFRNH